ncbi:MAG TPA: hypothetical protein VGB42_02800 [Candidatus Thermoplasmatota archaeon]
MGQLVPTGTAPAAVEIPSRGSPLRIDRVDFLVPMPPWDLPFVVFGRNPAFEHLEVRFREWERRFGLVPRRHPQVRAGEGASGMPKLLAAQRR